MKSLSTISLAAVLGIALALPGSAQVLIHGAGATFPYPMYSKWFSDYNKQHSNIRINYQSQGSGFGIKQVTEGVVDFGATDGPMTDAQIAEFRKKRGVGVLHFPTVLGAAVPAYNLPGLSAELNFTPAALAGIYLGKITKWNDAAIAKANPGVKLPGADIVVIHRSDGSGTTYVWTDFLSKVSPEWKSRVGMGTSVSWPVGLGGKGNEGVAGQIRQIPNAFGYVELIYAVQNGMKYGKVQNSAGKFVKADLNSITAAAAGAAKGMPADFRVSITNAPGAGAYPISSFTWLLIPEQIKNASKRKAITDFLQWMLTKGQEMAASLQFARLPQELIAQEQKAIARIH